MNKCPKCGSKVSLGRSIFSRIEDCSNCGSPLKRSPLFYILQFLPLLLVVLYFIFGLREYYLPMIVIILVFAIGIRFVPGQIIIDEDADVDDGEKKE